MPRFKSLGGDATVPAILKMSPEAGVALIEMHEEIMRGPSPLSSAERELIAACVSATNRCQYCYGVHSEAAKAYGIPARAIHTMVDNLEDAEFDEKLKTILRFARKLAERPASLTDADAQAVYDAGWDEKALHDAIMVVCCFSFMNRLLDGHGVHGNEQLFRQRGSMLKENGYLPIIRIIRPER